LSRLPPISCTRPTRRITHGNKLILRYSTDATPSSSHSGGGRKGESRQRRWGEGRRGRSGGGEWQVFNDPGCAAAGEGGGVDYRSRLKASIRGAGGGGGKWRKHNFVQNKRVRHPLLTPLHSPLPLTPHNSRLNSLHHAALTTASKIASTTAAIEVSSFAVSRSEPTALVMATSKTAPLRQKSFRTHLALSQVSCQDTRPPAGNTRCSTATRQSLKCTSSPRRFLLVKRGADRVSTAPTSPSTYSATLALLVDAKSARVKDLANS
jgi:hypothetical protein